MAIIGSPRGLTNGGERPALRKLRAPASAVDLTPLRPVVIGGAIGLVLFAVAGANAQSGLGETGRVALVAVAAGLAAVALWLTLRPHRQK